MGDYEVGGADVVKSRLYGGVTQFYDVATPWGVSGLTSAVPSVIEEDYLLADDLTWVTHARTGHAMMFDSTGKLTYAPNNLVAYSNDFTQTSPWIRTNAGVTGAAATIPSGAAACKLTASTTNNNPRLNATIAATSAKIVASVIAKKGEANFLIIAFGSNPTNGATWFNLDTGAVGTKQANAETSTIVSLGDGWYRCTAQVTGVGASGQFGVWAAQSDGSTTWSGSVGDGIYISQAIYSLVTYQTTVPYIATTTAAYYGHRMDYDPATLAKRGLLREMAATNVLTYSRDLNASGWTDTNITRVSTSRTSPTGESNAVEFQASAGNATIIKSAAAGSSAERTFSIWLKRVSGTGDIQYTTNNGSSWATQAITSDWVRYTFAATTADQQVGIRIVTSGDTIQAFGAQLEAGAFSTSYIPTTTASVTRNADSLTAALYTSDSVTEYYRSVADLTQSSRAIDPFSDINAETDSVWIEKFVKGGVADATDDILLEDGSFLLLESGDKLLLE